MPWTMKRVSDDKQETISSIELKRTGTKQWSLLLTGNHTDLPQPEAAGLAEKAVLQRFRELLAADEWVRKALIGIEDMEKRRQPHAQALADAQAKLSDIAAAKVDPKILKGPEPLGKKMIGLKEEEATAKTIASEAEAAINAIDPHLRTLREHLQQARQKLATQAIADLRQAVASEKAKAQDALLAVMRKPLDELAEIEARTLALGDGSLATRVLAGA